MYYLGKDTEFKKENCKEYKTKDGAIKAMAKAGGVVFDENGKVIASIVDKKDIPEGALDTNPDSSVPAFDDDGNPSETVDAATVAAITGEKVQNAAENKDESAVNTEPHTDNIIIPSGKMKVTVICDGTLNLRRSAGWENDNICGRASRGQSYYVKAIHTVDGKKLVQTIDDIYLSGQSEHVQFEQL